MTSKLRKSLNIFCIFPQRILSIDLEKINLFFGLHLFLCLFIILNRRI